jgi:hypothetical protein
MRTAIKVAAIAMALAACTPASPPQANVPPVPQPPQALSEEFRECTWGEVRAAGVSVWSFACPDRRLVGDESLPGFLEESNGQRYGVIQLFTKAPDAPIDAVLPGIRAASPGAETCVLEPIPNDPGNYQLMPTGETRRAYDGYIAGQTDGPMMPCGRFGPSEGGMVFIRAVDGAPNTIAVVSTPSDIPIFDWNTLRATQ